MGRIERAGAHDRFFNYCLWEYEPGIACEGKFDAATLLYHSYDVGRFGPGGEELVDRLRGGFGRSRTVWGVKWIDGRLRWEFYFYDYRRQRRERSLTRAIAALGPQIRCDLEPPEHLQYFMFSLDITPELARGEAALAEAHLYLGNVLERSLSSGVSYSLSATGLRMENLYYFFDPRVHREEMLGKICSSAFVDPRHLTFETVLWPELANCTTICLANKAANDCIYFSGINVDQFLWFLERLDYPAPIRAFVREHRHQLDHLRYDVGIDYRHGAEGLRIIKSGYYGTF